MKTKPRFQAVRRALRAGALAIVLFAGAHAALAQRCSVGQGVGNSLNRAYNATAAWSDVPPNAALPQVLYRVFLKRWPIVSREDYRGQISILAVEPTMANPTPTPVTVVVLTDGARGSLVTATAMAPPDQPNPISNDDLCDLVSPPAKH